MREEQYYLHRDGKGRFLLQNAETGSLDGWLFPAMPGESAHAFSYDYGSVWYPRQLINLAEFPELADMPFFTIESCNDVVRYLQQSEFQSLWPLVGCFAKLTGLSPHGYSSTATDKTADPMLWQYRVVNPKGSWTIPILDLWVNEQGCWFCTREGQVWVTNHQGELIQHYVLPKLTRCLAGCEDVPSISCDDGNLYDLTAKLPQAMYAVRPANDFRYSYQILAVEQTASSFFIADAYGYLQALNSDLELQWQHHQADYWQSWFLRSDGEQVYQGHYHGVNAYDVTTGREQWMQLLDAPVLCGVLTPAEVIVGCSDRTIYALQKTADPKTGEVAIRTIYTGAGVPFGLALAADGRSLFVGDYTGKIEQLDLQGNLKAATQLQAGAITTLKTWGDRLYVTTSQGVLIGLHYSA